MTEGNKRFLKRLAVVIGIITAIVALFFLMIVPPAAFIVLLGGLGMWILCAIFIVISEYLMG